jgi:hypothetical protein
VADRTEEHVTLNLIHHSKPAARCLNWSEVAKIIGTKKRDK